MTYNDIQMVIHSFDREELPQLMQINSFDSLLFHTPYIERLVRSSDYYKIWREYNREHEDATIDMLQHIETKDYKKISLELHHYPHTLFDIVQLVGLKILDNKEKSDPFEIAKVVLQEHLLGNIGYVPMLITDHQKHHSDLIELKEEHIKGNYKEFNRKYT